MNLNVKAWLSLFVLTVVMGLLLFLGGTPLALASYWGLLAFASIVSLIIWRLLDEEKFLARELPGYSEYRQRVRYRLALFVW